jgi:hypothetical protein
VRIGYKKEATQDEQYKASVGETQMWTQVLLMDEGVCNV